MSFMKGTPVCWMTCRNLILVSVLMEEIIESERRKGLGGEGDGRGENMQK